ncbi:ABC transporter substrate-binding protein [Telmatospirillum siberiense]|uniref:ABC transporter substrate-binding protein n=1 Tax=Telmatospirillum siberiense TaxID=382514 RepID=A0A2N3PYM3_9PROT|nr:ABC transporter substrate-binding protein [Telmatospirillum siberiense]PKU25512.1 ABC transporter substrate-binding protein [Telmatospirillum siberiense]
MRRLAPALAGLFLALGIVAQPAWAGGTLRIAMTASDIPLTTGQPDNGAEGYRFTGYTIYDALVNWDLSKADQPASLTPGLATSWSIDPKDNTRWIFNLRKGVTFHDGSAFNADAVVWNFEKVLNDQSPQFDAKQSGNVRGRFPGIKEVKKIDENTVSISTKAPDAWMPYELAWMFFSSPTQWEKLGKSWDKFAMQPSGTGPFKLTKLVPRELAQLEPNTAYWDKNRIPKTDKVILMPIPDPNTRTAALLSGQVDWIEAPAPDMIPNLKAQGMQITSNVYPHTWPYQFSFLEGSPWNDIRIRKAANLAVDREGLKQLLGGMMVGAEGMVTADHPWFGHPTFKVKYDPAEAKRLLKEAGYSKDHPIKAKILISASGSGQMLPLAMNEFIQQNLAEVGIALEFEVLEWQTLYANWRQGAKDPASRGGTATNVSFAWQDPMVAFYRFIHTSMIPPNGFNWGWYKDPESDALLDQARATFDPAKQDALLAKLHERQVDNATWLFIAHDVGPRALSPKVKGFVQARSWFQDLTPVSLDK